VRNARAASAPARPQGLQPAETPRAAGMHRASGAVAPNPGAETANRRFVYPGLSSQECRQRGGEWSLAAGACVLPYQPPFFFSDEDREQGRADVKRSIWPNE
jgi:hypothetical protein